MRRTARGRRAAGVRRASDRSCFRARSCRVPTVGTLASGTRCARGGDGTIIVINQSINSSRLTMLVSECRGRTNRRLSFIITIDPGLILTGCLSRPDPGSGRRFVVSSGGAVKLRPLPPSLVHPFARAEPPDRRLVFARRGCVDPCLCHRPGHYLRG